MDEYSAVLAKLLRLVFARWLERIEQKLQLFAEALDEWLHELFANPTIDWRDRFEQFLAEQEAAGYIVPPESRQELIAYLEHWAASIGLPTPEAQRIADVSRAFGIVPPIARPSFRDVAGRFRKRVLARMFFNDKLREARQRNDEIEQVLAALGRKLDAAEVGETVEAEPAAEAIEILIWYHNDAMEQARGTWLKHNLGNDDYLRIAAVSNPSAHGLPPFVDDEQAERFRQQVLAIGARLDQRIGGMDRAISVMHRLEQAGVGASLLIGGGVLLQAVRTGGKWAIVKTVAQVAASGAVAHATGKAVEHSLRAAGASEETIHGVRLAAEVVTWLLLLRRVHAAGKKSPRSSDAASTAALRDRKELSETPKSKRDVESRHPSVYVRGRYAASASDPGAYWSSGRRVFPTRRNSGLSGQRLRSEQQAFFERGLRQEKLAGELRGQAAEAGYERRGGIGNVGGPDRLADKGAENALQRAIKAVGSTE